MKNRRIRHLAAVTFPAAVAAAIAFFLFSCKPAENPVSADATSPAPSAASLSASPNPIPADGNKTTVSWNTGDGSVGEIWVSVNGAGQKLFAQEVKGSSDANWIAPGEEADFVLYTGLNRQKEIARLKVIHNK